MTFNADEYQSQDLMAVIEEVLKVMYRTPFSSDEIEWAYKKKMIERYEQLKDAPTPAPWPTVPVPNSALIPVDGTASKRARRRDRHRKTK
jgi:hypothetical protein